MPAPPCYAFIRIKGVKRIHQSLLEHFQGIRRPETATDRGARHGPPIVEVEENRLAAAQVLAEERETRKRKRGRRPHHGIMIMCSGPPGYRTPHAWGYDREMEWVKGSLAFIHKMIGDKSVVVNATLHRDETSPHLHVLVVPRDSKGVLAWKRRKSEIHGPIFGLTPGEVKTLSRVPDIEYCALQDVYWRECGVPFGLLRGVPARETRAKHTKPDREKAEQYLREEAEQAAEKVRAAAEKDAGERVERAAREAEAEHNAYLDARKAEREDAETEADLARRLAGVEWEETLDYASRVEGLRDKYAAALRFVDGKMTPRAKKYFDRYEKLVSDHGRLQRVYDAFEEQADKDRKDLRQLRADHKQLQAFTDVVKVANTDFADQVTNLNYAHDKAMADLQEQEATERAKIMYQVGLLFIQVRKQLEEADKSDAWKLVVADSPAILSFIEEAEAIQQALASEPTPPSRGL